MDRTQLHSLSEILTLSVMAVLCGADGFCAFQLCGRLNQKLLRTFLDLPHGISPHNT